MELYELEFPPQTKDVQELVSWATRELMRVAVAMQALTEQQLEETFVEPAKPRTGMVRLADGTQWDPGSGRGVYYYDETVPGWVQL